MCFDKTQAKLKILFAASSHTTITTTRVSIMARTAQKNSVKGIRGPKKAAQCSYNGVALPTDMAERRRMRNKLSAKVHREKKKDVLESAKQEVVAYDKELNHLKSELIEVSLICACVGCPDKAIAMTQDASC